MNRPTLARAVESVSSQMRDGDQLIVVGDHWQPDIADCLCLGDFGDEPPQYGNRGRNLALPHATGNAVAYLDDDDVLLPGAIDAYRSATGLTMFRAILPHRAVVWRNPVLRRGNCGTCTVCHPNDPSGPRWPVERHEPRGSDFRYVKACADYFGGVSWREEITYECRP